MRNFISSRAEGIPPSGIRKFFDIVATMQDVISLGIGEPDFDIPEPLKEESPISISPDLLKRKGSNGSKRDSISILLPKAFPS
jgi:aminotransferase